MRDKKINNKENELLSRRSFFRKVSQSMLPVVGAIILSNLPVSSNALTKESYDCNGQCAAICGGQCSTGCGTGCTGTCEGSCKTSCNEGCATYCNGTCNGGCRWTCMGVAS